MSSGPPNGFFTGGGNNQSYSLHSRILATIILSLVFVISILAILHIYVRCFLRHRVGARRPSTHPFRISMSITSPTIVPQVDSGLDPVAVAALPTFAYRSTDAKLECVVCLSTLEEGEMVKLLPNCKHLFHVSCIDMWLHSHSTCPVCRAAAEPVAGQVGEASAPPLPPLQQELGQTQESVLGSKEVGASSSSRLGSSSSSRLSSSFRKMLVRGFSGRREHGEGVEDLEKQ